MTTFALPPAAEAASPPEWRGFDRDGVRLLVARPGAIEHARFRDLDARLAPGDLVVVNTSATLPAALDGEHPDGMPATVHVSTELDDGDWVVELRKPDASGPELDVVPGQRVRLPSDVVLKLIWPYPDVDAMRSRLWRAAPNPVVDRVEYLSRHGRPIEYSYLGGHYPLSAYQTVYATEPGSAEMPSAGRPLTAEVLVRMMARGITVAPLVLHCGVSSPELHEPPTPEWFTVPEPTARLVDATRAAGGRVVAVGTTVVRALESAAIDGKMQAADGWTDLVLSPERPARVVNGLITGLHAPEASHLQLLESVAGEHLVDAAYQAAVGGGYLWHEFGDTMLFLP